MHVHGPLDTLGSRCRCLDALPFSRADFASQDTMTASRAYEAHILKQRLLLTASVVRNHRFHLL